jgi:hypothetical protein
MYRAKGLLIALVKCIERLFTAAKRHKQRYCDIKYMKKELLKATEHDKYMHINNVARIYNTFLNPTNNSKRNHV